MNPYRTIVLFGPPYSGKEDLVALAGNLGFNLDTDWPITPPLTKLREFALISTSGSSYKWFPPTQFTRVLVLPTKDVYDGRKKAAEAKAPAFDDTADDYYSYVYHSHHYDEIWSTWNRHTVEGIIANFIDGTLRTTGAGT